MKTIAEIVARIALGMPEKVTTGDLLAALTEAAQAGEVRGYERGMVDGQTRANQLYLHAIREAARLTISESLDRKME
jgi:hypothetical protein